MTELSSRCEAAEGPSRELDAEIASFIGGTVIPTYRLANGSLSGHSEFVGVVSGTSSRWLPFYTFDLGAAMTLVREDWESVEIRRTDDGKWHVGLAHNDMHLMAEDPEEFYVEAVSCATPALAICAAALRALAQEQADG